jgi:Fe2+ or Zn2+ uptake regulation protein
MDNGDVATGKRSLAALEEALTTAGHRMTSSRAAILTAILVQPGAFTISDLLWTMSLAGPPPLASVFRTLKLLSDLGLLRRIHSPTGCQRYCVDPGTSALLVCQECGRVVGVTLPDLERLVAGVAAQTGYRITTAVTNFFGSCPDYLEQGATLTIAGSGAWLLEEGPGDDTIVL